MDTAGDPLVSVIVPVFNAARFLTRCLEALAAQTLTSMEIIAVDDGSTDDSADILAVAQSRGLRVISHEQNQGVSAARNAGIDAARGRYLAFVDADDVPSPDMYRKLTEVAEASGADVVMCGLRVVDEDGNILATEPSPLTPQVVYDTEALRRALAHAWTTRMLWYPVRSLYRREHVAKRQVRFDEGIRKGEDSLFNLQVLSTAKRVIAIPDALYDYVKHQGSATARPLSSESDNLERLGRAVASCYVTHGFAHSAEDDFYRQVLRSDLPTAVVRLQQHSNARREVSSLLDTRTVREAFRTQRISRLGVPGRVAVLLVLLRGHHLRAVSWLLRVAR